MYDPMTPATYDPDIYGPAIDMPTAGNFLDNLKGEIFSEIKHMKNICQKKIKR